MSESMYKEPTAEGKSRIARSISLACHHLLDHPHNAHAAHELAASAHDNEAHGPDRERHLFLAKEHRAAASYWAKKELEWKESDPRTHRIN